MGAVAAIAGSWVLSTGLAAGCGGSSSVPSTTYGPIDSDGRHFRDEFGRTVILRGINARVEGVFDVTFDDGRVALEPIPALEQSDCDRMAELGFNLLRLPINWSGVEAVRDQFDESYLVEVDRVVDCARNADLLVLLDFHFDAYSKHIGEDGAPLWAILPPPEPDELLEGPLTAEELQRRRLSSIVQEAYESFFAAGDANGLQAELIDAIGHVAERYAEDDAVMGIEVFNEPDTSKTLLEPFNKAAAARIREAAPRKLAVFEPSAIRNFLDFETPGTPPFDVPGSVYAPHIYTFIFNNQGALADLEFEDVELSNVRARDEADQWQTPLLITEFGIGPDYENFDLWLRYQFDAQEDVFASSVLWIWKEESQGRWGFFDYDEASDSWTERPEVIRAATRTYARRIAGTPLELTWDDDDYTLRYDEAVDAPNVFFIPERAAIDSVTCNGAPVDVTATTGRVEVPCFSGSGEHVVIVETSPRS